MEEEYKDLYDETIGIQNQLAKLVEENEAYAKLKIGPIINTYFEEIETIACPSKYQKQEIPQEIINGIVAQTCDTFTRLLLSITPYKAKEFVEKNCAKVTNKITKFMETLEEV